MLTHFFLISEASFMKKRHHKFFIRTQTLQRHKDLRSRLLFFDVEATSSLAEIIENNVPNPAAVLWFTGPSVPSVSWLQTWLWQRTLCCEKQKRRILKTLNTFSIQVMNVVQLLSISVKKRWCDCCWYFYSFAVKTVIFWTFCTNHNFIYTKFWIF